LPHIESISRTTNIIHIKDEREPRERKREREKGKGKSGATRFSHNEVGESSGKGKLKLPSFHFLDQSTTSFFVTNFNDDIHRGDLWQIFARFGSVGEVIIPNKLNKYGKRFGFVKFKEVKDP
jgi:RNA recognition motif-containing protein